MAVTARSKFASPKRSTALWTSGNGADLSNIREYNSVSAGLLLSASFHAAVVNFELIPSQAHPSSNGTTANLGSRTHAARKSLSALTQFPSRTLAEPRIRRNDQSSGIIRTAWSIFASTACQSPFANSCRGGLTIEEVRSREKAKTIKAIPVARLDQVTHHAPRNRSLGQ